MSSKLDDMLSKWPLAPRSQLEWDEAAERTMAKIESPPQRDAASLSDDSLLSSPLPKQPEEGQTSGLEQLSSRPGSVSPGLAVENKMSKERGRERTSFQELAKLASMPPTPAPPSTSSSGSGPQQTPPPAAVTGVLRAEEAASTDSGIVDLKMIAMMDPSGAQRAATTALASEGLFDDDQPAAAPAAAASSGKSAAISAVPASAASSGSAAAAAAQAVAQQQPASIKSAKEALEAERKKGSGGVVIVLGTLVAVGAIAAGAFFFVKWQRTHHQAVATTTVSAPDKVETAKQATPSTTATPSASVAQNDDNSVDTVEVVTQPGSKPTVIHKRVVKPGATATAEAPAPTASGGIDPKLIANVPTGPAGGGSGDLAEAMKAAAGNTGSANPSGGDQQTGPKYAAGSVPQRPSQGQVAGAVGGVMPAAKACIGSDDPVSHATVVFQSDGTVKSVSITGFAAGKPAEACIKSALSKAKVDPFAEATYSIPVSIRP